MTKLFFYICNITAHIFKRETELQRRLRLEQEAFIDYVNAARKRYIAATKHYENVLAMALDYDTIEMAHEEMRYAMGQLNIEIKKYKIRYSKETNTDGTSNQNGRTA